MPEDDEECEPCKYTALIKRTCGELDATQRMQCKEDIVEGTLGKIDERELVKRLKKRGVEKKFSDAVEDLFG